MDWSLILGLNQHGTFKVFLPGPAKARNPAQRAGFLMTQCREGDLNPQAHYRHKILNLTCLPISPSRRKTGAIASGATISQFEEPCNWEKDEIRKRWGTLQPAACEERKMEDYYPRIAGNTRTLQEQRDCFASLAMTVLKFGLQTPCSKFMPGGVSPPPAGEARSAGLRARDDAGTGRAFPGEGPDTRWPRSFSDPG